MFVVTADESETLVCCLCHRAFTTLESSWLLSPSTGGEGRWVHRRCVDGQAMSAFNLEAYRLRRGDFVLRSVIETLMRPPMSPAALRDLPRRQTLGMGA
jgi:hypothetical protein